MGFPVIDAGVLLAPRGVGTMAAMILGGRILGKISARLIIGAGLVGTAYALYAMTLWTPDVSSATIMGIGVLQGFSIGLVFMPLSVTGFATLPAKLRTEGTGIFSLVRNLGSSIGISVTSSLLATNTRVNHAILAGITTPFNHMLQSGAPARYWNPASHGGAAALDAMITRQASVIAYMDDFRLMFWLTVACIPLVFLIRTPSLRPVTRAPAELPADGQLAASD